MKCIILDTAEGIRKLNPDESYPIALENVYNGKRVLDWHIKNICGEDIKYYYIGGYHIEKIINNYDEFSFYYDKNNKYSLDLIYKILDETEEDCLIIYSNILYKSSYIEKILESNKTFNIGTCDKNVDERFFEIQMLNNKSYYNGAIMLKHNKMSCILHSIRKFMKNKNYSTFLQWIDYVTKQEEDITYIKSKDSKDLVNVKNKSSLSQFILGTKAQTLENLKSLVKKATMLDQVTFTVGEWEKDSNYIYKKMEEKFPDKKIVIRSSSLSEDCFNKSNAGKFDSYLNVDIKDKEKVSNIIDSVIKSYDSNDNENQVLVQEYISNSVMSGVLFTRNLEDSSPYYLINYDDESGLTDTVTGGKTKNIKSKVILRNNMKILDVKFKTIIQAAKEIESLTGYDGLDIEFIVDKNNLYIVQVRPIATYKKNMILTDDDLFKETKVLKKYVSNIFETKPNVLGKTTILGNMPDWNPAELVGSVPRPLSLSLYQKLITNGIWAIARENIGYREVGYEPLVISLCGKPYVDVRKSLNSFLPNSLEEKICEKIVNYQIEKLKNNPWFHDKLEFKIAKTVLDFDFEEYEDELLNNSFTQEEVLKFKESLTILTNNILVNMDEDLNKQEENIKILYNKRNKIEIMKNISIYEIPNLINILINDCIAYGILPFSTFARYAFISVSYLKTLKEKNIISNSEYDKILLSIPTVASKFKIDTNLLNRNKISKEKFMKEYGHLRPNTYDINSLNYLEGYDIYFTNNIESDELKEQHEDVNWLDTIFEEKSKLINEELIKNNIKCDYLILKSFIYRSIAAREWSKFEFTKSVDFILKLLIKFGKGVNINRDDMSYIPIDKIISLSKESPSYSLEKELKRECRYRKKKYTLTQALKLPSLILSPEEIEEFLIVESIPNYITNKIIMCEVIEIGVNDNIGNINNKIVMIENADPGYDWIFSHKIKGLLTKYGGAASHMSIRCAEFGIPAAIGVGEIIYNKIQNAALIEINCEVKQIKVIK